MEWDGTSLSFKRIGSREEIKDWMLEHYRDLGFQGEAYIQEKMDFSRTFHILYEGERIGLFSKHNDGSLVNFIIDPAYGAHDLDIYKTIRGRYRIKKAEVPGFDLNFLGPALVRSRKVSIIGWYFADVMDVEPKPPKEGLTWKRVMKMDKDRVMEASCNFFDPIDYALDSYELYYILDGEDLAGIGILGEHYYTENAASCGLFVSKDHRRQGYGSYIVATLKGMCKERGLVPVAGCALGNIASRRTLESAGFMVKAPQLEVLY